jgi:hypothetical protein
MEDLLRSGGGARLAGISPGLASGFRRDDPLTAPRLEFGNDNRRLMGCHDYRPAPGQFADFSPSEARDAYMLAAASTPLPGAATTGAGRQQIRGAHERL